VASPYVKSFVQRIPPPIVASPPWSYLFDYNGLDVYRYKEDRQIWVLALVGFWVGVETVQLIRRTFCVRKKYVLKNKSK